MLDSALCTRMQIISNLVTTRSFILPFQKICRGCRGERGEAAIPRVNVGNIGSIKTIHDNICIMAEMEVICESGFRR